MSEIVKPNPARPCADDLLMGLRGAGPRREEAVSELHALLLCAARFEIRRRAATLRHVRSDAIEDLATQAADDACVAVIGKLHQFRGDSRFTTWTYKFALNEAAVHVRRRAWQHRETVIDPEYWNSFADEAIGPARHADQVELLKKTKTLIDTSLSARQRDVLVSLAIHGTPIDVLAERLGTTRGALYKSLHDARRTLRRELAMADYDLASLSG
jgi:RNA polymerase sigma-70 factor (ECF subfamily)